MSWLLRSHIFLLLFIFVSLSFSGQVTGKSAKQKFIVDSLSLLLRSSNDDSTRLRLKCEIAEASSNTRISFWDSLLAETKAKRASYAQAYVLSKMGVLWFMRGDNEKALSFHQDALKIRQETNNKKGMAVSYVNISNIYYNRGEVMKALDLLNKGLLLWMELGNKAEIARVYNLIGIIYDDTGDIPKALDYYNESLKINEQMGNKRGIGYALGNIGVVYKNRNDFAKALEYFFKSLNILEKIGDTDGVAASLKNIGTIYKEQGDFEKALINFEKSLKLNEKTDNKRGVASSLNSIGTIYSLRNDWKNALDYFNRSMKIRREIDDKNNIPYSLNNISSIYFDQKKFAIARAYADTSLAISKEMGFPYPISQSEGMLAKIDSATLNYAGAFEHFKQYILYRDSVNNESTRKASIKSQLNYEFEKKEAVIKEQQEKERVLSEEKNNRQQIIIWAVAFGLLMVVAFAAWVFRSLKTTKSQKIIIEEKQKEIIDSIHYAKRIQQSLLPNDKFIGKTLNRLREK